MEKTKKNIVQIKKFLIVAGIVYPTLALMHLRINPKADDSFLERLIVVSGYFLLTIIITEIFKYKISDHNKLIILKSPRWVMTTHYFFVVYRNELSIQYAMTACFLVFTVFYLFEKPKYFLSFAVYVFGLTFF